MKNTKTSLVLTVTELEALKTMALQTKHFCNPRHFIESPDPSEEELIPIIQALIDNNFIEEVHNKQGSFSSVFEKRVFRLTLRGIIAVEGTLGYKRPTAVDRIRNSFPDKGGKNGTTY